MTNKMKQILSVLLACMLSLTGCSTQTNNNITVHRSEVLQEQHWTLGFDSQEIIYTPSEEETLYIAGYNNGWEPTETLDNAKAQAVWLETNGCSILLIGIDCIALSGAVVAEIRDKLEPFCKETGCDAVNVYATHSHAGVDTFGLWGPLAVDGKNSGYMKVLIDAAVTAAQKAAENKTNGSLRLGQIKADILRDSRYPYVYDPNLYQFRFVPEDNTAAGIRLYLYGAHAESMRGDNRILSRDFPGALCDIIEEETGDRAMFMPGAIGGLLMTEVLVKGKFDATQNMFLTARTLANLALSIEPEDEMILTPSITFARTNFNVPLDNTMFMLMRFLGILENPTIRGESATGYLLQTELSVLSLGHLTIALIPGEIFPELVWDGQCGDANKNGQNPARLADIAKKYGRDTLLVIGLANDEIGYIVPPSDFLLNETAPYLEKTMDYKGENHYEETNSVGPSCAQSIADTFEILLEAMYST